MNRSYSPFLSVCWLSSLCLCLPSSFSSPSPSVSTHLSVSLRHCRLRWLFPLPFLFSACFTPSASIRHTACITPFLTSFILPCHLSSFASTLLIFTLSTFCMSPSFPSLLPPSFLGISFIILSLLTFHLLLSLRPSSRSWIISGQIQHCLSRWHSRTHTLTEIPSSDNLWLTNLIYLKAL